jgi:peptide/nickel transport system substrate-binding protein
MTRTTLGLAALLLACGAHATELRMGVSAAPSSLDPHFHNLLANTMTLQHVFEPLTWEDNDGQMVPKLAASWRIVDDTTWEFTLRPDARFHDGTPFTAEDVAFTLRRVPTVPNSPGLFSTFTRPITSIVLVNAHTLRLGTAAPYPFLPRDLGNIMILSARLHAEAGAADFASSRAVVGTGPYRFRHYTAGEVLGLAANPGYREGAPSWSAVTVRAIAQDGARVAALLAGDVALIDRVPGGDLPLLRADPRIKLVSVASANVVYLFPDGNRPDAPFVTDAAGQRLPANPLADLRVRRALALSIDRDAMANRLLDGQAAPALQLLGPGVEGRGEDAPSLGYDPAAARRLLAEAGYPDGFALTIHGPSGFIPDDAKMLQAVGQYFTRIGIRTRVEVQPRNVFFPRATAREYAMFLGSWTGTLGANTLRALVTTYAPDKGWGAFNRQRYSNAALDALMDRALTTLDDAARNRLIAEAERLVLQDMAVIPLVFTKSSWAMRAGQVEYAPSPLARTQAMLARPAR